MSHTLSRKTWLTAAFVGTERLVPEMRQRAGTRTEKNFEVPFSRAVHKLAHASSRPLQMPPECSAAPTLAAKKSVG